MNPNREKGMSYVLSAMDQGLPGNRDAVFTTVGKPKVKKKHILFVILLVSSIVLF